MTLTRQDSAAPGDGEQPQLPRVEGEGIGWALVDPESQGQAVPVGDGGVSAVAPARSLRRAMARRASNRRATARRRQGDIEASITGFLAKHPGSTVGDLAKALNLDPGNASIHLTHLAKTGEIKKVSHGYRTSVRGSESPA